MGTRFEQLGIAGRVRRIPAMDTPDDRDIGRALSHRRALELARRENLDSVLVIEDDAVFLQGATWVLRVVAMFAELGFDPELACEGQDVQIRLHACPFRTLASSTPRPCAPCTWACSEAMAACTCKCGA
jgi:hypothetical protein